MIKTSQYIKQMIKVIIRNRIVQKNRNYFSNNIMKPNKQTNQSASHQKNINYDNSSPPVHKEFQLMYRNCDKVGTNQQIQSLFLVKQKKISAVGHSSSQQTKSKKKKQPAKKKKSEEKTMVDKIGRLPLKSKDAMIMTKSTMPSSTVETFAKAMFIDTFNEKIDLNKSTIRKINNLSNSNSSRYLGSKNLNSEKSPTKKSSNRKDIPKSPSKPCLSSHKQLFQSSQRQVQNSKKTIERELKAVDKVRCTKTKKQQKLTAEEEINEYIFLDGQYIKVDAPATQQMTQKLFLGSRLNEEKSKNQFIEEFENYKSQLKNKEQRQDEENEESIEKYIILKIVFIQRWWRKMLQKAMKKARKAPCFDKQKITISGHQSKSRSSPKQQQINNQKIQKLERENFLDQRLCLIMNELESQKFVLMRMLETNKINRLTYSQSLIKIQTIFTKKMNKVMKLKQKIQMETQKTEELKIKMKQKLDVFDDLDSLPANFILDQFFNDDSASQKSQKDEIKSSNIIPNRQKTTGCHYPTLSPEKQKQKVVSYKKNDLQNSQITSPLHIPRQHFQHEEKDELEGGSCESLHENYGLNQQVIGEFFQLYSDRQIAQSEIEKRYAVQLGMAYLFNQKPTGIATSVVSIHNFLSSFLKFYEYFYKDEFLKLINLPYGQNQLSRLKLLQGYNSENWVKNQDQSIIDETFMDCEFIIGQQILDDFQEHSYQLPEDIDDDTKVALYFDKIHQRAIIDCFNESLNCFRPYYFISGAPYSWNYSQKALTFYFIAEQNIQEVFEKTQYKVLKNASSLCGTIVDSLIMNPAIRQDMSLQEKLVKYRQSVNIALIQSREEKLGKIQKQEIRENNYKWETCQQDKTKILFDIGNFIFESLILEILNVKTYGDQIENFDEGNMKQDMPNTQSSMKQNPSDNDKQKEDSSENLRSSKGYQDSSANNDPSQQEPLRVIQFQDQQEAESNSDFQYQQSGGEKAKLETQL